MSGKGSRPRPFSVPTEVFDNNWDNIFKKGKQEDVLDAYNEERLVSKFDKEELMQVKVDQIRDGGVKCGCGRSPSGFCNGWHGLSEDEYQKRLAELQADQAAQGD